MLKKSIALLFVLCLFSAAFAHEEHEKKAKKQIIIKTVKITDRVYMLVGSGGNIGVSVGEDGTLIIDDQFAPLADKIKAALKELGSDKPRFVLNTHWHGDHTGGNEIFGQDGTIISQTNVRKRLSVESSVMGEKVKPSPKVALPIITFDQSLSIFFNGDEIKALHFPRGHTDGDSVIFFTAANVVHMGDHFFKDRFPFVDLDNGGSVQGLIKNVGEIIAKLPADVKIIPGHGDLANLDDLKNYHRVLSETTAIVEKAMKQKKTLDEIKKAGLPAQYKSYGEGFIKTDSWIETVYKSLSMK